MTEARRHLNQRRGPIVTLIVDRARVKMMNLYAKLHAGMYGDNEPIFMDANDATVVHELFIPKLRRGTWCCIPAHLAQGSIRRTVRHGN